MKNKKWTPKSSTKTVGKSCLKEKALSGSGSARKSLGPAFEESERSFSGFMAQMLELL